MLHPLPSLSPSPRLLLPIFLPFFTKLRQKFKGKCSSTWDSVSCTFLSLAHGSCLHVSAACAPVLSQTRCVQGCSCCVRCFLDLALPACKLKRAGLFLPRLVWPRFVVKLVPMLVFSFCLRAGFLARWDVCLLLQLASLTFLWVAATLVAFVWFGLCLSLGVGWTAPRSGLHVLCPRLGWILARL